MQSNSRYSDLRVFSLGNSDHNKTYKGEIERWFCDITDEEFSISRSLEKKFADTTPYIKAEQNVRGKDVYVISSLYGDQQCVDGKIIGGTVQDKFMNLLFFVSSLVDASADRITVVYPYDGYSRQDRKTESRAPIYTKYTAMQLEQAGANRVLTLDVHNLAAFQNAFRIPCDNLEARKLFADYAAEEIKKEGVPADDEYVVLSPDSGGMGRTKRFRNSLSKRLGVRVGIAYLDKERISGVASAENIIGNVTGRKAIVIDDIIASGKTIDVCRKTVESDDVGGILWGVFATHGLFVGNANEYLQDIRRLVVTDAVDPYRLNEGVVQKFEIIPTTKLFAQAIRRTHVGDSLSELIED